MRKRAIHILNRAPRTLLQSPAYTPKAPYIHLKSYNEKNSTYAQNYVYSTESTLYTPKSPACTPKKACIHSYEHKIQKIGAVLPRHNTSTLHSNKALL